MTRKIAMTQAELNRKTIIEEAGKLGISEQHFRQLLSRYREKDDEGWYQGIAGKPSGRRSWDS